MLQRARTLIAAAFLIAAPSIGRAAITPYSQNFEGLVKTSPTALSADGWVVFGNVSNPAGVHLYGYGTFPAPNAGSAFCAIADLQGGVPQGVQQLSIYSDYNNTDHAIGNLIESNVFHEQTISAGDVGRTWTFQFDAKLGNLVAPSKAAAFIKTINPAAGFSTTNFIAKDMTTLPVTWSTHAISITIDAGLPGQLVQFGFNNTATNYVSSGVFYDNLVWNTTAGVGDALPSVLDLRPNTPNPFTSSTRLDFSLPQRGFVDVGVFDIAGRRVATLFHGIAEAGPQSVIWDGRRADGRVAAAGVYHAALESAAGRVARRMVFAH